jgi:multiple sugar transport system permease protein
MNRGPAAAPDHAFRLRLREEPSKRAGFVADQTSTANQWPAGAGAYDLISPARKRLGWTLMTAATLGLLATIVFEILYRAETETWRPAVYAYVLWGVALGIGQVLTRGEDGQRALFLLPALLFTIAMVIFPTLFGFYIALTDWNLSSFSGRKFNGLDNFWQMLGDPYYRNALFNMVLYVLAVAVEYVIAFGLALLLNAQIRARKFFRVVFLMPLMLSPVAVSWMIGKSLMEYRFGPAATLARHLGWDNPAFFSDPITARISIMILDAWTFIPFMMIMLLAGLQAMSREVLEAARVDGANAWQTFWQVTFPLMLPVSVTAVILRIIFKLKLADIIITVTSGGPGGATDSVSSFIYREYRDRSNVGYGTMLAMAYLVIIVVFVTWLLKLANRFVRNVN